MEYLHLVKYEKEGYLLNSEIEVQGMLCLGDIGTYGETGSELVEVVMYDRK